MSSRCREPEAVQSKEEKKQKASMPSTRADRGMSEFTSDMSGTQYVCARVCCLRVCYRPLLFLLLLLLRCVLRTYPHRH